MWLPSVSVPGRQGSVSPMPRWARQARQGRPAFTGSPSVPAHSLVLVSDTSHFPSSLCICSPPCKWHLCRAQGGLGCAPDLFKRSRKAIPGYRALCAGCMHFCFGLWGLGRVVSSYLISLARNKDNDRLPPLFRMF